MPAAQSHSRSLASLALACASIALGTYSAAYAFWIIYRFWSPVPFLDQWNNIIEFVNDDGRLTLTTLWTPHHEHRIPFAKLANYADLCFFGGKNISLFSEIFLIQILGVIVLGWMFKRYGSLSRSAYLTALGFFCFCAFSPIQSESFAFQLHPFLSFLASSVAIAAFVVHDGQPSWFSGPLLLSFAAGIVAEFSLANGLLIWPVLLLCGFALNYFRKTQWLTAATGIGSISLYMIGYKTSPHSIDPWQSFRYIRTYFAFSWDEGVPSRTVWPHFSEVFTCIALGFVLIAAARLLLTRAPRRPLPTFLIMSMLFLLATAAITSTGRLNFGVAQAASARYQTSALLFWACFGGLILLSLPRDSWGFIAFQLAVVFLMAAGVQRFPEAAHVAAERQVKTDEAYVALADGDIAKARYLHPRVDIVKGYAFMKTHHYGPDVDQLRAVLGTNHKGSIVPATLSEAKGFQVVPGSCVGFLESAEPAGLQTGEFVITGWAWSPSTAGEVILALEDGTVLGRARVSLGRPDVLQAIPTVTNRQTGWTTSVHVPPHSKVHAFLALTNGNSVCPLAQQYAQP